MTGTVLILRPEPGASATAERARQLGLDPIKAPLFAVRALEWAAPASPRFDAVMLTSANAPRLGGGGMTPFLALPCYAVGEATAEAARGAGFADVRSGPADAAALLQLMASDRIESALHLCGRDHSVAQLRDGKVMSVPVYAAEAVERLPAEAETALATKPLVLLHSPRAAALFAGLAGVRRKTIRAAAISAAAANSAGPGWAGMAIASEPRDEALLELAAKLCQTDGSGARRTGE